ncbi:MAG TPA: hypothetical protein VFL46_11825 [Phycicoccus sp.]|nr:hypothetical protein [Phycicoccus sp.]
MRDLEASLRELGHLDPGPVDAARLASGARRRATHRRRRAVLASGVAVVVVAAVGLTLAFARVGSDRSLAPLPAGPSPLAVARTIGVDAARPTEPTTLSTTRTLWLDPANDLDTDRYLGLTEDGLVVRAVFTAEGMRTDVSLVDPVSGRVDRLPAPPAGVGEPRAVSLAPDRLVFLVSGHSWADSTLRFDRESRRWSLGAIVPPEDPGHWLGYHAEMGPDDRIYLASDTGTARQLWWSVPVTGGAVRREAALEGLGFGWDDGDLVTVDRAGRVVVTHSGARRVVSAAPPAGCTSPGAGVMAAPPGVDVAGDFLLVTFTCREGPRLVVLDDRGKGVLALPGMVARIATGSDGALIALGERMDLYYLDPAAGELWNLGRRLHEDLVATAGGLMLWNEPGPTDSDKVYDVVYHVARHP